MRRFVLVFLMLLLPLQWSWAAAASVCAHEADGAHFGHHEHKHTETAAPSGQDDGDSDGASVSMPHADCHVCHGIGGTCLGTAHMASNTWHPGALVSRYSRALPEPPIEAFLRPPLNLAA